MKRYLILALVVALAGITWLVAPVFKLFGVSVLTLRLPLVRVRDDTRKRIEKLLAGFKLLPRKSGGR